MAWYVNDLSLCGQYNSLLEFLNYLAELMRQREQMPILNKEFYCSRTLHTRAVTPNDTFQTAVQSDRALLRPVLSWLTKNGPFWEDDRQPNTDDYFVFGESDVTDQGLGEAARRTLAGKECLSFSFPKGDFDFTPVEILQGLPESPLATISITNIWTQLVGFGIAA